MDHVFLRFSVGLHLVFRQFRKQQKMPHKKLHHSALHPHKGARAQRSPESYRNRSPAGAGGGSDSQSPGDASRGDGVARPRTSLLVTGEEQPTMGGPTSPGNGREQATDFLNVYYLHEAFCPLSQSATPFSHSAKWQGDDSCVLHQRFNFTFAEKFGNANTKLQATITRIELPAARGRALWRPDLPWDPIVRSPVLLQIDRPQPTGHHDHNTLRRDCDQAITLKRLCFYFEAAPADEEKELLLARESEAAILRQAEAAAQSAVEASSKSAAIDGESALVCPLTCLCHMASRCDMYHTICCSNFCLVQLLQTVAEQLKRCSGPGTMWKSVIPKAHVRDQPHGKVTRNLDEGEVVEEALSEVGSKQLEPTA